MDPLITVDELAGYLQRDLDRYSATLAVQGASGLIRAICGWGLSRTTETLTMDCNGGVVLKLPTMHLNAVNTVTCDGVLLGPIDYSWSVSGLLVARTCWPHIRCRIAADVDHGYDPIPDEIRIVACSAAGRLYNNPEGLKFKAAGGGSRSYHDALSELEQRLISAYQLV